MKESSTFSVTITTFALSSTEKESRNEKERRKTNQSTHLKVKKKEKNALDKEAAISLLLFAATTACVDRQIK